MQKMGEETAKNGEKRAKKRGKGRRTLKRRQDGGVLLLKKTRRLYVKGKKRGKLRRNKGEQSGFSQNLH